jgi:hypothetical protein
MSDMRERWGVKITQAMKDDWQGNAGNPVIRLGRRSRHVPRLSQAACATALSLGCGEWSGPFTRHMDDRFRVSVWPDGPYGVFDAAQNHQHLVRVLASSIPVPTRQFWFVDRPVHRGISTRSVHSPQVSSMPPPCIELAGGLVLKIPSPSIVTSTNVDESVASGRH